VVGAAPVAWLPPPGPPPPSSLLQAANAPPSPATPTVRRNWRLLGRHKELDREPLSAMCARLPASPGRQRHGGSHQVAAG
jgi:hypothetical protein